MALRAVPKLSRGFGVRAKRQEPVTWQYYGVRFKDGVAVFMPRALAKAADHAELTAYALHVRGNPAVGSDAGTVVSIAAACAMCAREIPRCTGCDFNAAKKAPAEVA